MLRIGQEINGFMGGMFGRDSYSNRKVEAIGVDWVVLRSEDGFMELYNGDPELLLIEHNKNKNMSPEDI